MYSNQEKTNLINSDPQWANLESEINDRSSYKNVSIAGSVFVFLGGVCNAVGLAVEYVDDPSTWLWGWCGLAIGFYLIGVILLLSSPCVYCAWRDQNEYWNNWKDQPQTIYWRKQDFPHDVWLRYIEEEYGEKGRSAIKYDRKKFITYIVGWIFLCGLSCALISIRLALHGDVHPIGSLDFGAFVGVLGVSIGTFVTLLPLVIQDLAVRYRRYYAQGGPYEFIANENAFVWLNQLHIIGHFGGCVGRISMFEGKRLNHYHGKRHPCVEVCMSFQTKNGKRYLFFRIPVPPNKMNEAEQFAATGNFNSPCWKFIEGYAKDIDDQVIV